MLGHPRPRHVRLGRLHGVEIGGRGQDGEIEPAGFVLGQEHDSGRAGPALRGPLANPGHRQRAADDRLHGGVLGGDGKFQCAEQIGPVGQAHRGHVLTARQRPDHLGLDRAFQQRIGRTNPQMHEGFVQPGHDAAPGASAPRLRRRDAPPDTPSKRSPRSTQAPSSHAPSEPYRPPRLPVCSRHRYSGFVLIARGHDPGASVGGDGGPTAANWTPVGPGLRTTVHL